MQINLFHHPDAFASLDAAFDPMDNIAYGADFLRRLHRIKVYKLWRLERRRDPTPTGHRRLQRMQGPAPGPA